MKRNNLIRIAKIFALLLPIVIVMAVSQHLLFSYADANTDRIHDFYNEPEDSLDVVFLGASELFADFSPAYAYEQYGFTSYLYAQDANPGSLYASQLKEILAHQSPRLLVVEINGFLYSNDDMLKDEARLRIYTESMPLSKNKIETIMAYDYEDKLSCFFPFIKYHGDWKNLSTLQHRVALKTTNYNAPAALKGIYTRTITDTVPVLELDKAADNATEPITDLSEQYLRAFLEDCKASGCEQILFLRAPHKLVDDGTLYSYHQANRVGEIVREYGYTYLNLDRLDKEMQLDPLSDFYNSDHLNIYGQQKLTTYLGKLITEEYGVVPAEQTAENTAQWNQAVRQCHSFYAYVEDCMASDLDLWLSETPDLLKTLANYQ